MTGKDNIIEFMWLITIIGNLLFAAGAILFAMMDDARMYKKGRKWRHLD